MTRPSLRIFFAIKDLKKSDADSIIHNTVNLQVLHNGSAPASQAGCVGSIPITCSKNKGQSLDWPLFLVQLEKHGNMEDMALELAGRIAG